MCSLRILSILFLVSSMVSDNISLNMNVTLPKTKRPVFSDVKQLKFFSLIRVLIIYFCRHIHFFALEHATISVIRSPFIGPVNYINIFFLSISNTSVALINFLRVLIHHWPRICWVDVKMDDQSVCES